MGLPKAYEPANYEADIYKLWEQSRIFQADPTSDKPRFSISMPPPNETGTLHIGSAIFVTLQDILIRHARQQGKDALWLPGTDHAAIATDNLVEKMLAEQGISKQDIGREKFIAEVRRFVGDNRDRILAQFRAMGASCDWSRTRYTLDEMLNRSVNETFVKMHQDGLIYRGNRIVNWDPKLETTVSDDEVDHVEEQGVFYTLQYGPFQIGTARPETKFGDKYVVMHPDDDRYRQYEHGDTFEAEWINGPVKAMVIKDEAVDPSFGTGVMTITPWHDHTDFEIAERHGLEKEQIIDFNGKLMPIAGEFAGQAILEARPKIIDKLKAKGLLVKEDDSYIHNLAINSRGKGLIEPQIMLQWFVDVNRPAVEWKGQLRSLREVMRAVIEDGDIEIIPKRFEKIYYHWIDNLRDWCISRQIWWGHQVPVWYKDEEVYAGVQPPEGQGWRQDPDTLDTWFSSALWTWSTLLDPKLANDYSLSLEELLERSPDFKTYHPTSVMETGWDILFFWVARMILATTYVTGQVPFKQIYLHGLVRTEDGKKMSKSDPDTIIDPLEIIPQYGTDALRLALVSGVNAGQDQRLGISKIVDNRNFCNKLWNVARYIESTGEGGEASPASPADHWILNKLSILTEGINKDISNFRFSETYQNLYHFIWDDLADWYIEASKQSPNIGVLRQVLDSTLILIHPFAPFITEAIWRQSGHKDLLAQQLLPQKPSFNSEEASKFEEVQRIVRQARHLITATGVVKPGLLYQNSSVVEEQTELIKRMGRLGDVKPGQGGLRLVGPKADVWLELDLRTAQAYIDKLKQQLNERQAAIKRLSDRLANSSYTEKAPSKLVEETKRQLEDERALVNSLQTEVDLFQKSLES
jgi:valyl-tRNA synthetase